MTFEEQGFDRNLPSISEVEDAFLELDAHYNGLIEPMFEDGPLNTDIEVKKDFWSIEKVITVGNTGLFISKFENIWLQSYTPDNYARGRRSTQLKHARVFGAAFLSLLEWKQQSREMNSPDSVVGITNNTSHKFRRKLLSHHYQELGKTDFSNIYTNVYKIQLLDVAYDSKVMERLAKLSNLADKKNYQMRYGNT